MRAPSPTVENISRASRRRLAGAALIGVLAMAGGAFAQPEPGGSDNDPPQRLEKGLKALTCTDNTCTGKYADIVDNVQISARSGQILLFVKSEVTPYLQTSSHACARDYYVVLQFSGETNTTERELALKVIDQLQLARVMDYDILLEWEQSNYSASWMVCQVSRVVIY